MNEICINLPERLTARGVRELAEALAELPPRPLFLLGGAGRFCSGLDLAESIACEPEELARLTDVFADCLERISHHGAPTVAVVQGPALGGGLGLAMAADLVLAGPDASFGLPELLYGLVPGVILPYLVRRVPLQTIRRLALTGLPIDRESAGRHGLVDECFDDPPEAVIRRWARILSRPDPDAARQLRSLLAGAPTGAAEAWRQECRRVSVERLTDSQRRAALADYLDGGAPPWEALR